MAAAPQLDRITPGLSIWHRYDGSVKAELFSTALRTHSAFWLIDPIAIDDALLGTVVGAAEIAGVIVTNANHFRNAAQLSARFDVAVHAHPDAQPDLELPPAAKVGLAAIDEGLKMIPIAGGPPGEIAVYSARDGGTLVVGDALINMDGYGFTFLPAKYCEDPKVMRKSLHQLLDYTFERLLFAHGAPIVSAARYRLVELLKGAA